MAALGATFGKYFLSEQIATGGMAEIYLAKLIGPGGFEKQLVLKLIHPELSEHRQFVEMFVAEAKTLVSLTHGNIVPVYELGVVDGTYFLAMEYIDGPTLAALEGELAAAGERFDPPMAAYITAELLKGLDYAHRKGESVIHRDISPRNVMLSREGEVKLVDFGLAVTELSQKTRRDSSGLPAGSFPYMSPEQVRQEPLDRQTDLFSAGVIFWEMLTGERLFHRNTADDTLAAVESAAIPSPSSIRANLDPVLDAICARALARDRGQRYQSAGELLAAVNKYLYGIDSPPTPGSLAQLVARRLPPRPHASAAPDAGDTGGDDRRIDRTVPMAERKRRSDGTTPLPARSGRAGDERRGTATFATHAAFEDVLARATPLFPVEAIDALDAASKAGGAAADQRRASSEAERETEPPRRPARPWLLRALGLLALVGGGVGIGLVLASGRDGLTVERDAGASAVAPPPAIDAGKAASPMSDAAALPAVFDAGGVDAAPVPPPADAAPRSRIDAAPAPVRGTGTLKVGARPWGDVYIDSEKIGQAPGQWKVPAGRHRVEVRYPADGDVRVKRFTIEIRPDDTHSLGIVDFTR